MSASAIIRPTSSAVGIGGSPEPTTTSAFERRIASASSAIGRVTTIFTSASESMPPQFRRAQTRRGRRGRRSQRAHVGAPREGGHPIHAPAGHAAEDQSRQAAVLRSDYEWDSRRARARRKARDFGGRRKRLGGEL